MHTFWITFYSYKGGVGRSMSLANVAAELASRGRRVLMIDFDLEAPGLDSFEEFDIPSGKEGVVEYVCHYLETGAPAPVGEFLHRITPLNLDDEKHPKPRHLDGTLWLMTSGAKNEAYNDKRLSINWADLYENQSGADFFENFKADIEDTIQPDYVFIDSRTGLTDVGGVCTLHLPDLVVLLFALNEQNLQGIASVARVLRDSEKLPQLLPVATPVPNIQGGKESLVDQRMQRAKELLGVEPKHSLPYFPLVALKEQILQWNSRSPLWLEYRKLADSLAKFDPAGIDFLQREAESAISDLELERAEDLGAVLQEEYHDRADAWITISDIAKAGGDLGKMEEALLKALDIAPANSAAFAKLQALYKGKKRIDDLIDLLTQRIDRSDEVGRFLVEGMLSERAELLMTKERYEEALADYEAAKDDEESDEENFVTLFNISEARRRATGQINSAEWSKLISIFETMSTGVSSMEISTRANYVQAMHIAEACVGNVEKAKSMLREAKAVLGQTSKQERLFCVATYTHLLLPEFLQKNSEMLESLEKGELWDGMKIPASG